MPSWAWTASKTLEASSPTSAGSAPRTISAERSTARWSESGSAASAASALDVRWLVDSSASTARPRIEPAAELAIGTSDEPSNERCSGTTFIGAERTPDSTVWTSLARLQHARDVAESLRARRCIGDDSGRDGDCDARRTPPAGISSCRGCIDRSRVERASSGQRASAAGSPRRRARRARRRTRAAAPAAGRAASAASWSSLGVSIAGLPQLGHGAVQLGAGVRLADAEHRGDLGVGEAGEELERDQLALARLEALQRGGDGQAPLAVLGALVGSEASRGRPARRSAPPGGRGGAARRGRRCGRSRTARPAARPRSGSKRLRLR